MHCRIAGFLRRKESLALAAIASSAASHEENRPLKAIFMPDDSRHIFSNHALHMTQHPDRPKAKPPEFSAT